MKLLNAYLDVFNCGNNRKSVDAVTAPYTAEELENALADLGPPGSRAFDRHEWLAHPQGHALTTTPPIEIVKIADEISYFSAIYTP
jgi:hypothetical protein